MEWTCPECTYINSFDDPTCIMCESGYRLFSEATETHNEVENCSMFPENNSSEQESLLTWTDNNSSTVLNSEDENSDSDSHSGK